MTYIKRDLESKILSLSKNIQPFLSLVQDRWGKLLFYAS